MTKLSFQIKQQLELFILALGFFTRIPVPDIKEFSQTKLNHASRYFSLVGWFIGAVSALCYLFLVALFPLPLAVLLTMGIGFLLTGCFHEDGLADTADGLGGGWTPQQKLTIMKDSRLGSYGAVGLWFTLTTKFVILTHLSEPALAFLVAHPLSRIITNGLIYTLSYVSDHDSSKAKPLAETMQSRDLWINTLIGGSALLLVSSSMMVLIIAFFLSFGLIRYFLQRQLGGFTGDTLGAAQQVSELLVYMILLNAESSS